jgi:archaellum component FlaD/FlaE
MSRRTTKAVTPATMPIIAPVERSWGEVSEEEPVPATRLGVGDEVDEEVEEEEVEDDDVDDEEVEDDEEDNVEELEEDAEEVVEDINDEDGEEVVDACVVDPVDVGFVDVGALVERAVWESDPVGTVEAPVPVAAVAVAAPDTEPGIDVANMPGLLLPLPDAP